MAVYEADDATVNAQKSAFYAAHPDWQHRPVPMTRPARIMRVWAALLESQNGRDVDDGRVTRPHKLERYGLAHCPPDQYPRMLIVGAGVGREVLVAQEAGWKVRGQTLGPRNVAFGAEVLGVELTYEDAHATLWPRASFDCIMALQVLEHSPAPLALLIECARLLRPGGVLVTETPPSHAWTMGHNLHHVLCPTPRQAVGLFRKAGFPDARAFDGTGVELVDEHNRFTFDSGDLDGDLVTVGHRWAPDDADFVEPIVRQLTEEDA